MQASSHHFDGDTLFNSDTTSNLVIAVTKHIKPEPIYVRYTMEEAQLNDVFRRVRRYLLGEKLATYEFYDEIDKCPDFKMKVSFSNDEKKGYRRTYSKRDLLKMVHEDASIHPQRKTPISANQIGKALNKYWSEFRLGKSVATGKVFFFELPEKQTRR